MATRDVVTLLFAATSEKPANLSGKDLRNLDLVGVDFKRASLKGVFLFGADLSGAKLSGWVSRLSLAVLNLVTSA